MKNMRYCTKEQLLQLQDDEEIFHDSNKYSLYPIPNKYRDIWKKFKEQEAAIWKAEEIEDDTEEWRKLSPEVKTFIKHILAFFAVADGVVNENLAINFSNEIEVSVIRAYYTAQEFIESVHQQVYSELIERYIEEESERETLFNSIENFPCIQKKTEWAQKWMNRDIPFAMRIMAFAIMEGVFFSGAFCAIFWLKKVGNLKGLFESNFLISRDESLHTEVAVLIFKKLKHVPNQEIVHEIFKEAVVDIEIPFIVEAIPCDMIGMNSELMSQYIKFVADRLLVQLGYERLFHKENPFDFMENIGMENVSNFHTERVTEYSRGTGQLNEVKDASGFDTSGDF